MKIHRFLDFFARDTPDNLAVSDDIGNATYAEVAAATHRFANAMADLSVGPGDRIVILSENRAEISFLAFAASRVGAVICPLQQMMPEAELIPVVEDTGAKHLWHSPDLSDKSKAVAAAFRTRGQDFEAHEFPARADLLQPGPELADETNLDDRSAIIQLYTSGTTGKPKGVVMSHKSYNTTPSLYGQIYRKKPGPGTVQLVSTPMSHIGGFGTSIWPILTGSTAIIRAKFDAETLLQDLVDHKVDGFFAVPAMLHMLVEKLPEFADRDKINLSQILYGAAPISVDLLNRAREAFECGFVQFYGLSETTISAALTPADHDRASAGQVEILRSVGRAIPTSRIKICDDAGNTLPAGETGEILTNATTQMIEYWNMPEETAKTIVDGWVHTGDIGKMDENGYLYLLDRMKDMVISGGKNIYPTEVEGALASHPDISQVAVIGIPDEKMGEALLALIIPKPGKAPTVDEVIEFCRDHISAYKIPRQIELVDDLPRNPVGKVLKKVLREKYWSGTSRAIN